MRSPAPPYGIDASRSFGSRRTGTEQYATAMTRELIALAPGRCRLYFRRPPTEPPPPGAVLRILPAPRLWTHLRLGPELALRPPGLVFIPAHVMPLVCRPPAVVTVHDLGYEHLPWAHPWRSRAYLRWSTARHVRLAARLVADSEATRKDLIQRYGADPDKVRTVLLAPGPGLAPPDPAARASARAALGLPPATPYLLHVGTLQPRKNLPRLLESFSLLASAWPELRLVLAGMPGWGRENLAARMARLGIADRVLVPGFMEPHLMAGLYGEALALVMPSLYEGFGLPVVEAMACGIPVVCSRTSSLPEAAGGAALLVDPSDSSDIAAAVARLLQSPDLRADLVARGLRRAAELSWSSSARQVLEVFEEVLGE